LLIRIIALLALVICAVLPDRSRAAADEGPWPGFLRNPTAATYRRVVEAVDACRTSACERSVTPDSSSVMALIRMVDANQPQAIDAAFLVYRLLDGGDLEDVARSLGKLADRNPDLFLRMVKTHHLKPAQLRGIAHALPDDVVDDDDQRERAIGNRIRALSSVVDPALAAERELALAAVRETSR
jgi:hypothetical protein